MVSALMTAFAESSSADFSILLPEFVQVESVFSPVLIANITDRTGNLYAPLCSKFKVITNSSETKKLYLKANTVTGSFAKSVMNLFASSIASDECCISRPRSITTIFTLLP